MTPYLEVRNLPGRSRTWLVVLCGALLVESIENRRQVARAFLIEALLLILFAALAWMDDRVLSRAIPQGALLLLLAQCCRRG